MGVNRGVVVLPAAVRTSAAAMARAALPNEACGLLSGPRLANWEGSAPTVITGIEPVTNTQRSPRRFALDGQGMIDAETGIEARGEVVVGVFHSHPTSEARPSDLDRSDGARYDPDSRFVHLIVSLQGFAPTLRAWRIGVPRDGIEELVILDGDAP